MIRLKSWGIWATVIAQIAVASLFLVALTASAHISYRKDKIHEHYFTFKPKGRHRRTKPYPNQN